FFLLVTLSLFSCADLTLKQEKVSMQFSPNFSISRDSSPGLEPSTNVSASVKMYTRGKAVTENGKDLLVDEINFSGTWQDFTENFQVEFHRVNVWHDVYVKVTVAYTYTDNSTPNPVKMSVLLQGCSDTVLAIRGARYVNVELERAANTKIFLYKDTTGEVVEEGDISTKNKTGDDLGGISLGGPYFCFSEDGILHYYKEDTSSSPPKKEVSSLPNSTSDITLDITPIAIKADGSDIWALSKNNSDNTLKIEKIYPVEKPKSTTVNLGANSTGQENGIPFEIKGNNVYLPTRILSDSPNAHIVQGIKRMTFDPRKVSDGLSAEQTGYVDISPTRLGLSQDTRLTIRDMLIQQGKLYILVNNYSATNDNSAYCRGGVIRIPLSAFDQSGANVETWGNGVKILGLSPDKSIGKKSNAYFYMPARFIARRHDELVIADDGFYWDEKANSDKQTNAKRVVFLDLDKFSMDVVDVASGSSSYLFNGLASNCGFQGFNY
ncbi:MAG: hypothetical protein IJR49_02705, partial [Treponema sp.]|nr:hypothetical protein [Treponema sp.]